MMYSAHQACAYGGGRPKWTLLAFNHKAFRAINKCCPGESAFHVHKPWGLITTSADRHFATAEETAYPLPLAHQIAKCFASALMDRGWKPPPIAFTDDCHVQPHKKMRAVTNSQPKAARLPPLVPEHKQVVVVSGPFSVLRNTPVFPMQRLKQPFPLPEQCASVLSVLPAEAQLLRTTPMRSNRGGSDGSDSSDSSGNPFPGGAVVNPDLDALSQLPSDLPSDLVGQQAGGIPFTPDEFISEAVKRGHPKTFGSALPSILAHSVSNSLADATGASLASARSEWFRRWLHEATIMQGEEKKLKAGMPEHMAAILDKKRLLLWRAMLADVGYTDCAVVDEVCSGVELTGDIPPTGIFELSFKAAELTVQALRDSSHADRLGAFYSSRSSGDDEIDRAVLEKTQAEIKNGWARGPLALDQLPNPAVVSRRFGLRQSGKVRLIDDMSGSAINMTVQSMESPKPHGTDMVAALVLEILKTGSSSQLLGRSFDMKSAYKQLALSEDALWASYVAIFNPVVKKPELYHLLAAPFGATRSVYTFLRVAHSIWFLGVAALSLMWTCFFDDFVTLATSPLAANTSDTVKLLFKLLGWIIAEDGDKAKDFSEHITALGICVNLTSFLEGKVLFTNTEKRVTELVSCIKSFLESSQLSVHDAQKLRGRMQFADGQLFGRVGSLCMRSITKHAFEQGGGTMDTSCRRALERFSNSLQFSAPRLIQRAASENWYIFTDACFEPGQDTFCGIGGVLVNGRGELISFFSERLSADHLKTLGHGAKKTVIFEAELLALIVGVTVWERFLRGALVVCYIDNNSARDVAISASARNSVAHNLLDKLITVEMASRGFFWYARVPSPSNIADAPSRLKIDDLVKGGAKKTEIIACLSSVLAEVIG